MALGKVLITQGTRPFAQRVARHLPASQQVYFATAEEVPQVLINTGNYVKMPQAQSVAFSHEVLKICLDLEIDAVIPLGGSELYPMAGSRQLFDEYGISVWTPQVNELEGLAVIENPPRQLPLLILCNGTEVAVGDKTTEYGTLSGVFVASDDGDELALCCIGD